jgi:hypothetical protein
LFTANVGHAAASISRDKSRPTAPDGNVGCSKGWADRKEDGVRCYAPNGDLIGKIHVPETVANLTFGGMEAQSVVHLRLDVALCVLHERASCHEALIWRRGAGLSGRRHLLRWPEVDFSRAGCDKSAVSRLALSGVRFSFFANDTRSLGQCNRFGSRGSLSAPHAPQRFEVVDSLGILGHPDR